VQSLPVLQVVWLRFLFHAVFSAALLAPKFGSSILRARRPSCSSCARVPAGDDRPELLALQYLQLAETGAIQFSVPIIIALIAAPLLGERMDRARWAPIGVGFVGVLVIVPRHAGFPSGLLLAILNAFMYALFNLLTRTLAAHDSPETTQFYSPRRHIVITPRARRLADAPGALQWTILVLSALRAHRH